MRVIHRHLEYIGKLYTYYLSFYYIGVVRSPWRESFSYARDSIWWALETMSCTVTGDVSLNLSISCNLPMQEIVEFYFNLGLNEDIIALLASRHQHIVSERHLKLILKSVLFCNCVPEMCTPADANQFLPDSSTRDTPVLITGIHKYNHLVNWIYSRWMFT